MGISVINEYLLKVLNVKPDSTLEDAKKSYHKLAKENHPDLFPKEDRHKQELKMMKINQAYMSIVSYMQDGTQNSEINDNKDYKSKFNNNESENVITREVGSLKDPSYTYYKLGFNFYSSALKIFNKRARFKRGKMAWRNISHTNMLKLAIQSIQYFEKSYQYFLIVVNDYPDCIWASDAQFRLNKLSKFNILYQKICENISSDMVRINKTKEKLLRNTHHD